MPIFLQALVFKGHQWLTWKRKMQLKTCVLHIDFLFVVSGNFHAGTLTGNMLMTSTMITDFLQIFSPLWVNQSGGEKRNLPVSALPALASAPFPFTSGRPRFSDFQSNLKKHLNSFLSGISSYLSVPQA